MHPLVISEDARLDILEAILWYENQRTGLGYDFELCLEVAFNQIQRNPLLFEKRYKEIRIHFLDRFPYGIHYLSEQDVIRIFGVFHTSRNPNNWPDRLK